MTAPVMNPLVRMGWPVAGAAVFGTLSRAMFALNRSSAMVPARLPAGTLVNPAPLPLNVAAVRVPVKFALPLSKATLDERRASGIAPMMLAAATALALAAVTAAPAF